MRYSEIIREAKRSWSSDRLIAAADIELRGLASVRLFAEDQFDVSLQRISVSPESRGDGLAISAMTKLCKLADRHGCVIHLEAHPDDDEEDLDLHRLINFYRRFGFLGAENPEEDAMMWREPKSRRARSMRESVELPSEMSRLIELARSSSSYEDFAKAIDTTIAGQSYRSRNLADAINLRREGGSLSGYDVLSQEEWFGKSTDFATKVPTNGRITLYRASPTGHPITPGDYVSQSLRYVKYHVESNLGGSSKIVSLAATLDDIVPADGPCEFWYVPAYLDQFSSLHDFFEKARK